MRKLIVVSGGTKGIGRAIVEKFADQGFDIVTTSRSENDLKALQSAFIQNYPAINLYHQAADLAIKAQVTSFADYVLSLNRNIDILVNNSGMYIPGQVHNEPDHNLDLMLNTNLLSAYNLTRALIGNMIAVKRGHIFNMCSVASITPYTNGGSYCISKYAMLGMGKVLREEMKPFGIKVTNIMPGATKTGSWDGVDLPENRLMLPEDVAEIIWSAFNMSVSAVIEDIVMRPQLGDV